MSKNRYLNKRPIVYGKPLVISVQYERSTGELTSELRAHPRRPGVIRIGPPYDLPSESNSFTIDRFSSFGNKCLTQEVIGMITDRAKDLAACLDLPFIDERKSTQYLHRKAQNRKSRERRTK